MGEIGLAERHEARVEITPNEKKQKGDGGEILIGDGVDDGKAEVDAKQNFGVGHPASFVPVFFGDEGIFLAFDLELRRAHKFAFDIKNRFEHSFRVANGNADASGHHEGHVKKSAPPAFGTKLSLRDQIKTGDGASGSEKERQIDEQHLKPALIETDDHGGKKHRRKKNHQWITDVRSEVKKGFSFDVPGCIRAENLRKNFFCCLHQALGPARLLRFEAIHIDGKFAGTFHVREIEKFPAFELRAIGKIGVFGQGVVFDARPCDFAGFVSGIVEHLNVEKFERVVESGDRFDETFNDVTLVENGKLNAYTRPLRDGRRRAGNVLTIFVVIVNEPVAMKAINREDDENDEVWNHHHQIERVEVIDAGKSAVGCFVPVVAECALCNKQGDEREIHGRR